MVMILSDRLLKLSTRFWFCYRRLMNRNFPKALHWSPREVLTRCFFNPEDNICELLQLWIQYFLVDGNFVVVPSQFGSASVSHCCLMPLKQQLLKPLSHRRVLMFLLSRQSEGPQAAVRLQLPLTFLTLQNYMLNWKNRWISPLKINY